jgi:hypothetical protein
MKRERQRCATPDRKELEVSIASLELGLTFAKVEATVEAGENTLIAAPEAGKSILVVGYALSATAEGKVVLKTASGTHAALHLAKGSPANYNGSASSPAFLCAANKALVLETAAAQKAFGHITYLIV